MKTESELQKIHDFLIEDVASMIEMIESNEDIPQHQMMQMMQMNESKKRIIWFIEWVLGLDCRFRVFESGEYFDNILSSEWHTDEIEEDEEVEEWFTQRVVKFRDLPLGKNRWGQPFGGTELHREDTQKIE